MPSQYFPSSLSPLGTTLTDNVVIRFQMPDDTWYYIPLAGQTYTAEYYAVLLKAVKELKPKQLQELVYFIV